MKNTKALTARTSAVLLCLVFLLALGGCGNKGKSPSGGNLWDTALYTEDTSLGEGGKTLTVKVTANDKTVIFTLHTDKKTVGDALLEQGLASGEGTFIDTVNGIKADYNKDKAYWAFNQNGKYMTTGVYDTSFTDKDSYELVYTK